MKTATISRSRFVQVPAEFLDTLAKDKEIAWVWMVLWDKAGASKEAWISVAGLTERCKMNVHTIKAALRWLVENGYVRRISRPGMVTHYELSLERKWAAEELTQNSLPLPDSVPGASRSPRLDKDLGPHGAPPTWGLTEPHELQRTQTSEPIYEQPVADERPPRKCKLAERAPEASGSSRKSLELPTYAEPFRGALESWMDASRRKHKHGKSQLTARDLKGLSAAHEMGVLKEFCDLAAESSWRSIGFSGHVEFMQKLQRDAAFYKKSTSSSLKELTADDFC